MKREYEAAESCVSGKRVAGNSEAWQQGHSIRKSEAHCKYESGINDEKRSYSEVDLLPSAEVVKWQTRTFEGRVAQAVRVQVPPSAPITSSYIFSFPPLLDRLVCHGGGVSFQVHSAPLIRVFHH